MTGKEFDKINNALEKADETILEEWLKDHPSGERIELDDIKELLSMVVNFNVFIHALWLIDEDELPEGTSELREKLLHGTVKEVFVEKEGGYYA